MPQDNEGNKVSMQAAFDAWEPHAVALLTQTAKRYNGFVTYAQLADFVQAQTGVTHSGLIMNWMGLLHDQVTVSVTRPDWPVWS